MDAKTMTQIVRQDRRGAVVLLSMAHKPSNSLSLDLRQALARELDAIGHDATAQAVVLCSDLGLFSAALDLDAAQSQGGMSLADLCLKIETFGKPVIAAINGKALGAGLELALAAHARIGEPAAQFGMPYGALGMIPGAGGTQRLTRLVGAGPALRLLIEGNSVSAVQGLAIGLLDEVAEQDLRGMAVVYAAKMALQSSGGPLTRSSERRDGMRDGKGFHAAVVAARSRLGRGQVSAHSRAIDCVEAASILSPEQGLDFEAVAHAELADSAAAKGLRHIFFAERRATLVPPAVAKYAPPKLEEVAIWGAGAGIAELTVQVMAAGLRVILVDADHTAVSACLHKIAMLQERAVVEGRQSSGARDADWARLSSSSKPDALVGAGLVLCSVDAGPLPPRVVNFVALGALPARAAAGRVALVPAIAAGLVAELSHSTGASVPLMARVLDFGRRLGWRVVFTGPGGPVSKRLSAALVAAINHLETKGLSRPMISAVLGSFGIGAGARAAVDIAPQQTAVILQTCLAALANQGAKLLSEGMVARPSDLDAIAVLAGIFPRWQGGPMFQADQLGLLVLRADLLRSAKEAPEIFNPDLLIDNLISEGRTFASLNGAV